MASDDDKDSAPEEQTADAAADEGLVRAESEQLTRDQVGQASEAEAQASEEEEQVAAELGVQRYVHAAFFGLGILVAFLMGKVLLAAWNSLAGWPEAVRAVPFLISQAEDERASLTLVIGAVVGVLLVLRYYRRPAVRSWATEVAGELARVTWPNRETVTNGTIVVLIAGAAATFYVAVLDRLWGYLTNLIYGA